MLLFGLLFSAVLHSFRLCPALVTLGAEASSCAVPGVLCSPPSLHLQGPRPSLAPASAGSILGRDVVWGPSSGREELGTANFSFFSDPRPPAAPRAGHLGHVTRRGSILEARRQEAVPSWHEAVAHEEPAAALYLSPWLEDDNTARSFSCLSSLQVFRCSLGDSWGALSI